MKKVGVCKCAAKGTHCQGSQQEAECLPGGVAGLTSTANSAMTAVTGGLTRLYEDEPQAMIVVEVLGDKKAKGDHRCIVCNAISRMW